MVQKKGFCYVLYLVCKLKGFLNTFYLRLHCPCYLYDIDQTLYVGNDSEKISLSYIQLSKIVSHIVSKDIIGDILKRKFGDMFTWDIRKML